MCHALACPKLLRLRHFKAKPSLQALKTATRQPVFTAGHVLRHDGPPTKKRADALAQRVRSASERRRSYWLRSSMSSLQGVAWYADLAALTYPTPPTKKPAALASPKARAPSEAQDQNFGSRNNGAPLSLVLPRP
jgi:hypothetical protein